MKQRFIETYGLIKVNFKTLILFEMIYRIIGAIAIFPILSGLFFLSIRLSGHRFITNSLMYDYLTNPTTILTLLVMLFIIGVYIAYEMVVLSILFHYSREEKKVSLKDLLNLSLKNLRRIVRKFHFMLVIFAIIFFITVNLIHISGIASTLSLPQFITDNMFSEPLFITLSLTFSFVLFVLFLENIFSMNVLTLEDKPFKHSYKRIRKLLKGERLKIIMDFAVLNTLINVLFYAVYTLVILLISVFIFITRGQAVVLGALLTVLYTVYLVIAAIASFIVLPLNYAWMSEWYHSKTSKDQRAPLPTLTQKDIDIFSFRFAKPIIASIMIFALIFNGVTVYATVARRGGLDFFNRPEVVAHRGSSMRAPENTMAAIDLAIEENSDGVEIDVQFTSDGVPILFHDSRIARTTDSQLNRRISDLTYEEVQALDAGSWFSSEFEGERIPTLAEALEAIKGNAVAYIDMKAYTREATEKVVEIVEALGMENDVKILSFNSAQLRQFKALNEDIETIYLVISFYGSISALIDIDYVDNYGFQKSIIINNPSYAERIRSEGKGLYVWTVNSESNLENVRNIGVDGVITDDPILAREVAYQTYSNPSFTQLMRDLFN